MDKKAFDRIFIIIFENQIQTNVLENPFMRNLGTKGVQMSNYFGVMHPSQPNYVASIAGLPFVKGDDCPTNIPHTNLVDLLEAKGVTWKAYMEDLPADSKAICKSKNNLYFRKHNPFISFDNIRSNPARLANVVNAKQLQTDVQDDALPEYCWYTPNIQNDGHSPPISFQLFNRVRGVNFLAKFLQRFLEPLLSNPKFTKGTLIVVTFDESFPHADNHIYTVLLGDMVKANTVQSERYDHYSLLRTVEENFNLGTLNRNDLTASWFGFLWGLPPETITWKDNTK